MHQLGISVVKACLVEDEEQCVIGTVFVSEKELQTWAPECDMWSRSHEVGDHWYKRDEGHLKQI